MKAKFKLTVTAPKDLTVISNMPAARETFQGDMKTVEQNMQLLTKREGFTSVTTVSATEKGNLNSESTIL